MGWDSSLIKYDILLKGKRELTVLYSKQLREDAFKKYQVCCQSKHMRDALVSHRLIATPSFYKHTNTGQGGIVLQRCYHQTVWKLGHLKQQKKHFVLLKNVQSHCKQIYVYVQFDCNLQQLFVCRREQHLPGHFGKGEVQLRTVRGLWGVQSELHFS